MVSVEGMTTTFPSSLLLVLCVSASAAFAQAPASGDAANPASKKKESELSRETSAAVLAGYSYQPPKPVAAEEDDDTDLRDTDKPRNEIIRLPKHVVEATRPPVFKERNFYTPGALRRLAAQRYLGQGQGLNRYQIGNSGENIAMQMYWDDERLKNMTEAKNQVSLYRLAGDEERASKAEAQDRSTFLRVDDASTKEISRSTGQRY
jgi:hypothetical protein